MAKQNELQFLGIPEMKKQFDTLTGCLQRRVLRQSVNAGAVALSSAIRKATPRSRTTGTSAGWSTKTRTQRESKGKDPLRRAVKRKPSSQWRSGRAAASKGIIGVTVGYNYKIAPHAHLVEHGHQAVYWGRRSSDRVKGQNFFNRTARGAAAAVRNKITAKARQALPKAITKAAT